jgi:hypothetical protein
MFEIKDCKADVLTGNVWMATDDYALFHFTSERIINTPYIFDDCYFYELCIDHKEEWGGPIPSTFQLFFPHILEVIMVPNTVLLLNVVDIADRIDFRYLDNEEFINSFLKPRGYDYFFLNKEIHGEQFSTLFFECSVKDLTILEEVAYPGVFTDIDGFILEREKISLFVKWHQMGNVDVMFRDLIKNVYLSFGIWYDKNGMFIVNDKLDSQTLKEKLESSDIVNEIRNYIHCCPR